MMQEVNFDGLVSPTHNFSGLAAGNLASTRSSGLVSRPRDAALQGLEKMRLLAGRGLLQAFLPPQLRPSLPALARLGFRGDASEVFQTAHEDAPHLFAACCSASSMWTANAATIAPSADTGDGMVHFTPANLVTNFHRSIEAAETTAMLRSVFASPDHFAHHDPLPPTPELADEGAANHTRLTDGERPDGLHLFVYGKESADTKTAPRLFPARQTLEACRCLARLHQLSPGNTLFIRQNPEAIDAGVFHNDVISVGHENVFLYHEAAFADTSQTIEQISDWFEGPLHLIKACSAEVSIKQAVDSYLFNSQILTLPGDDGMLLLCPEECRQDSSVRNFIETKIVGGDNPIAEVVYQDLRQSMRNGGGPACLRLRVALTEEEQQALPSRMFISDATEAFLRDWIKRVYPEELTLEELVCAERYEKNKAALKELREWMGI